MESDILNAIGLARKLKEDFCVYSAPTYDGRTIFSALESQPADYLDYPFGLDVEVCFVEYYGDEEPIAEEIENVGGGVWIRYETY